MVKYTYLLSYLLTYLLIATATAPNLATEQNDDSALSQAHI